MRRIQHIHFVGAGGIGMCGIAELLASQGYRITGSDQKESANTERLRSLGIAVAIGHDAGHVGDADVVVYSSAVRADNPELRRAEAAKIPVIGRAEMLAELMRLKDGIAVAGSHGKTTTTSLIAHVLDCAGLDPTAVVGGRVLSAGRPPSTTRRGAGSLLVAEADESDGSFLRLAPVIAVVTNIDPEHLDHYGSYPAIQDAFAAFCNRVPFWGAAVLCVDHPGVQAILPRLNRRAIRYGTSAQADWIASEISRERDGQGMGFSVRHHGQDLGRVRLRLAGQHNALNALAALAAAHEVEVPFSVAADALESFLGIERRFEDKGTAAGVRVIDDYGHHPAEIEATLAAAREVHGGRIVVAFQPHRYTRTRDLWEEFTRCFNHADVLVLTEIYAASENKLPGIEASLLADAIRDHGHRAVYFERDLDAALARLVRDVRDGDLVVTLGAGSIATLGARLIAELEAQTVIGRELRAELSEELGPAVRFDVPLARLTSLRVGGPIDAVASPANRQQLCATLRRLARARVPHFVLGGGFNSLALDAPVAGVVIQLSRWRRLEERPGAALRVEAGVSHSQLTRFCCDRGFAGLEFGAGIPGSIGGWIAMNAGIPGREVGDRVLELEVASPTGSGIAHLPREVLHFRYRSLRGLAPGSVILSALLRIDPSTTAAVRAEVDELLARREKTQPLSVPSCGSVFKNPPGDFAGRLIEAAGLKGHRVGGAQISPLHANFIANLGGATASDVMELIRLAKERVRAQSGTRLECEVRIVGGAA